jgi:CubicO group peptidase (beta-lactamase class C family)
MQRGNTSGGTQPDRSTFTLTRLQARCSRPAIGSTPRSLKSLSNLTGRQNIAHRLAQLTPSDGARWGIMSVHQMVCHLDDSYKVPLGEKNVSAASGLLQRTLVKQLALYTPLPWPRGVPTRPEVEQGKGGSLPTVFHQDLASLLSTLSRFCDGLAEPCLPHPIFFKMTTADWMRWGYLHADHHLRQFGR